MGFYIRKSLLPREATKQPSSQAATKRNDALIQSMIGVAATLRTKQVSVTAPPTPAEASSRSAAGHYRPAACCSSVMSNDRRMAIWAAHAFYQGHANRRGRHNPNG